MMTRISLAAALFVAAALPVFADPPTDAAEQAKVVGQPVGVAVLPEKIELKGPRALQQIVVTGKYADGTIRDLTPFAELKLDAGKIVRHDGDGMLTAEGNGTTTLQVKVGPQTARVPVTVRDFEKPSPTSFRNDVVGAL